MADRLEKSTWLLERKTGFLDTPFNTSILMDSLTIGVSPLAEICQECSDSVIISECVFPLACKARSGKSCSEAGNTCEGSIRKNRMSILHSKKLRAFAMVNSEICRCLQRTTPQRNRSRFHRADKN